MPRWYQIDKLLKQVQLLVVPRPGYAIDEAGVEELRKLGAEVAIADLEAPAVSSTAYRENGDTEVLTPPVEDYIHKEHLYACQDAAPSR
jgi:nicotinate-nucleotide adenylyltransferase